MDNNILQFKNDLVPRSIGVAADGLKKLDKKRATKLCVRRTRDREMVVHILDKWPNVREAVERLAFLITDVYPFDHVDSSLVAEALDQGAEAYRNEAIPGQTKVNAFTRRLIHIASEISTWQVIGRDGNGEYWRWPGIDEPLPKWCRQHDLYRLEFQKAPRDPGREETLRTALAYRIMSVADTKHIVDILRVNT